MFKFSKKSLKNLHDVHPDLIMVMARALELSKVDFAITQGARTIQEQRGLVAAGLSKTMDSRHVCENNACGLACAVDVAAWVEGAVSWDIEHYKRIGGAVYRAAIEQGTQIELGVLWPKFTDGPHIQLSRVEYH